MKILAIFGHRPHKIEQSFRYSGLDYRIVHKRQRWTKLPDPIRLSLLIPATAWMLTSPFPRKASLRIIQNEDPDIIFTHGGAVAYHEVRIAKKQGRKLVMRLGGHVTDEVRDNLSIPGWRKIFTSPLYKSHYYFTMGNLELADHIITVSEEMRTKLCNETGRDPDTVSVLPTPVDIAKFRPAKDPPDHPLVLSVTNLNFQRKVQALQDFLPAIRCLHSMYNTKVIAPGRRRHLLHSSNIDIQGFTTDMLSEYQRSSVLLYFSYLDGCPNTILEAMCCKVPVIANDCDWSRELIRHGETGFLVNSSDEAVRYTDLILNDQNITRSITERAYEYAVFKHSEQSVGMKMRDIMGKVISQ